MRQTWKIVGWSYYYGVAIESRWFEGREASPFESVFYASFEELAHQMSIHNYTNR